MAEMTMKGKRSKRHRQQPPSTSADYCSTSEEEQDQDMANCLILLAQGRDRSAAAVKSLYLYQCKTCDRCFPSFQALGGHRASHKKPKNNLNSAQQCLSLELSSYRPPPCFNKVHECSICGAQFASGQALGGHMRRHRALTKATAAAVTVSPSVTATATLMVKKERKVLGLDLNLPAPEDDRPRAAVAAVFSAASPLVDCHY